MRTLYQTEEDARRENEAAKVIGSAWDCELWRFPALCSIDWFAERAGKLIAVVELKSRTHTVDRYPTLLLSATKWLALRDAARGLHVPALLVVRFADDVFRVGDLEQVPVEVARIAGRTDRNDPTDRELCVFLSVAAMRELYRSDHAEQ